MSRVVTVIDAGRSLNPKPARNQIEGAVVMGVGMALFEETHYDERFGVPINNNLADYILPTNADSPTIDVTSLDYPDKVLNTTGGSRSRRDRSGGNCRRYYISGISRDRCTRAKSAGAYRRSPEIADYFPGCIGTSLKTHHT